jgi:hypothetical protein
MNKNQNPKNPQPGLSLIQVRDGKEAMLSKMRGKLAGASEAHVQAAERRRNRARNSALSWTWKIALAVMFVTGNIIWWTTRPEGTFIAPRKHAPVLPPPAETLSLNEKALYWAYALYDFDQLKAHYGVGKETIVDSRIAAANLKSLLPKVDAKTRFLIDRYMPMPGRDS